MRTSGQRAYFKAMVDTTLESFSRRRFRGLTFPSPLEERFEKGTRGKRSRRMWLDGVVAICGFNFCLFLDYFLIKNGPWISVVRETALVTPVTLVVCFLVRRNPTRAFREGSVAIGMLAVSFINLAAQGSATAAATLFGTICVLITAMFVGIVMRLRYQYVTGTLAAMLFAGIWSLSHSPALLHYEAMIGSSMLAVGIVIILVASVSLEFEERHGYLVELQRNLQAEELAWANQALQELSNIDNLTRLPNRRALDERVEYLWKECADSRQSFSAIVIDVDNFKLINDAYGHLFGDEILRYIGALLPRVLRSVDEMAARFGGEEFVLLLPGSKQESATAVAEEVRYLVANAVTQAASEESGVTLPPITVSCGVSTTIPCPDLHGTHLIAAADEALYLAKRNGRNRVEYCHCSAPSPTTPKPSERIPPHSTHTGSKSGHSSGTHANPISKLIGRR